MTTRSRGSPTVVSSIVRRVDQGVTTSSGSNTTVQTVGTSTGSGLKGYKHLLRNAAPATTAFSASELTLSTQPSSYSVTFRAQTVPPREITDSYSGVLPAPYGGGYTPVSLSVDPVEAENQALKYLVKSVKSQQIHVSGPTVLGELRESIRMIRHPADALMRAVKQYVKGNRSRLRTSSPKVIADSYLEYSFGWQPLFNDVRAVAETIARFEYDHRSSRARGVGISEKGASSYATISIGHQVDATQVVTSKSQFLCKYLVGVSSTDSSPAFGSARRLAELSGFTLQELPMAAYELLPWSFLLDYFANIDDILQASLISDASIRWINKTQRTEDIRIVQSNPYFRRVAGDVVISERSSGCEFTSRKRSIVRQKLDTLPLPTLRFTLPGLTSQYANMIALLMSRR